MAEEDVHVFRKIAVNFLAGVMAAPCIVLMHPGHMRNRIIEFIRGIVGRGISGFLNRALEMGGWRESIRDGFIASISFFGGGFVCMLVGLLVGNFVARAVIITVFGASSAYICLRCMLFWTMAQRNRIQPFANILVIVFVTGATIGFEELCRRKLLKSWKMTKKDYKMKKNDWRDIFFSFLTDVNLTSNIL